MTSPLLVGKFSTKLGDFNVRTIVQLCQLCCADPTLHSKLFRVVTYHRYCLLLPKRQHKVAAAVTTREKKSMAC